MPSDIENLKGSLTMERFGQIPDQRKEVVSSMAGTQISIAVKCNVAKMVAKSNSCRDEAVSCVERRKTWWDRPT